MWRADRELLLAALNGYPAADMIHDAVVMIYEPVTACTARDAASSRWSSLQWRITPSAATSPTIGRAVPALGSGVALVGGAVAAIGSGVAVVGGLVPAIGSGVARVGGVVAAIGSGGALVGGVVAAIRGGVAIVGHPISLVRGVLPLDQPVLPLRHVRLRTF